MVVASGNAAERLELSHAGAAMSTAKAEPRRPTGVGCSDLLGQNIVITQNSSCKTSAHKRLRTWLCVRTGASQTPLEPSHDFLIQIRTTPSYLSAKSRVTLVA